MRKFYHELEKRDISNFNPSRHRPYSELESVLKDVNKDYLSAFIEYLSADELEALRAEQEYMTHGPGKIEAIINSEMERLQTYMESKIAAQDEEFLAKV